METQQEKKQSPQASRIFAAGSVVFFVVLGQGMNMLQEMLLAAYFGTTWVTDAYKLSMAIPMMFSLESIGIVNAIIIPVLYIGKTFEEQRKIFTSLLFFFLIISFAFWILLLAVASPLFDIVAGGFSPEGRSLSLSLFTITSSLVALTIIATYAGNVLNSRNEFGVPALQKAFMFAAIIPALYFGAAKFGIESAAWGAVAGMVLFIIVAFWRLFGHRLTPLGGFSLKDPAVRQCIVLAAPLVVYSLFNQVNVLFEKKIAADFPSGTLSSLDYALKSSVFFINFLGVGITTVIFPTLSEKNAEGDVATLRDYAERLFTFVVFAVMPFIIFLLIFKVEFVRVLFERGAFTKAATAETSSMLGYYALGLLGHAVVMTFPRFFQALRNNATIMRIGISMVGVNVLGLIVFPRLAGPIGIPIAFIVTYVLHACVLLMRLQTILAFSWATVFRQSMRILAASLLFAGVLLGAHAVIDVSSIHSWTGKFGSLAAICVFSCILYIAAASALKVRMALDIIEHGRRLLRTASGNRI